MKILITSGGTTEAIDQVRSITNHSTGQLGKIVAEQFLKNGHQVTLVTTKTAVKPQPDPRLSIHLVHNVQSLIDCLEPLVKTHDVLIHSMAVSDYTPVYMTDLAALEQVDNPSQFLSQSNQEGKISSAADHQVLFLKKTPKVIQLVKTWNPSIRLIGFKLLVDVPKDQLLEVARASLTTNKAELIVANDLKDITAQHHQAYLIDDQASEIATTKEDIAKKLYERVITHA